MAVAEVEVEVEVVAVVADGKHPSLLPEGEAIPREAGAVDGAAVGHWTSKFTGSVLASLVIEGWVANHVFMGF